MRLTVLGGCGAWPAAGQACSGYLLEHGGFALLIDPGYAIVPRLLEITAAERIDAVLVSHGHPDHCADLHPLLRARTLRDEPAPPLDVHALPDAVTKVLALDRPGMLDDAYALHVFDAGETFSIGPFDVQTWSLPHSVPNVGTRLTAGGHVLAYTGDTGPSPAIAEMAAGADVFLAEATFPETVPTASAEALSSAAQAGANAALAEVGLLVLTHLQPGTDRSIAHGAAARAFAGAIEVARPGTVVDLEEPSEASAATGGRSAPD
jgi:ribonuclease BN (tRNA processing enzyme)